MDFIQFLVPKKIDNLQNRSVCELWALSRDYFEYELKKQQKARRSTKNENLHPRIFLDTRNIIKNGLKLADYLSNTSSLTSRVTNALRWLRLNSCFRTAVLTGIWLFDSVLAVSSHQKRLFSWGLVAQSDWLAYHNSQSVINPSCPNEALQVFRRIRKIRSRIRSDRWTRYIILPLFVNRHKIMNSGDHSMA